MTASTWSTYTDGMRDDDLAMLERLRSFAVDLDGVTERVTKSGVAYVRERSFTSAYVKSHYLEVAIDLLEEATHPKLRTAFHTTKKVITHRLTFSSVEQIDAEVELLIRRAWETVGPGTR